MIKQKGITFVVLITLLFSQLSLLFSQLSLFTPYAKAQKGGFEELIADSSSDCSTDFSSSGGYSSSVGG